MEQFHFAFELAKTFGLPGVILFMWWWDGRKTEERMNKFGEALSEVRQMYLNNVSLLKTTHEVAKNGQALAENQQTYLAMSTERLAALSVSVNTNQYCPMCRIDKEAKGPQR